ncbi:hypothetical protein DOK78_000317 [Enterococcus sp. DIV2402]|uniref:Uncharacterized protein n=1 Tax=Candidatus Enterococcus lowellii TaxID=2230877 RepID=A0ABZ2SMY8_9ENTE|nr:hypothetical protein [Enterococcus sp. DIV2402]MBO0464804.1 hypothetical protein [Enterococcus sp. DIV2402]
MYENTVDYFYESLANSLKKRKIKLGMTNSQIYPAGFNDREGAQKNTYDKRVSRIINNRRTKSHPYLMSETEVSIFTETLKYNNEDELLWGHIDWSVMYDKVIQDLKENKVGSELNQKFIANLIDFVSYAELHYYESSAYGKEWGRYTKKEKENITNDAIGWCYFDESEKYIYQLREKFLNIFSEKKLTKFDIRFTRFLNEFLKGFLLQFTPTENSFGQQVLDYQKKVDVYRYKHNELLIHYQDEENEKTLILDSYLDYAKKHIKKLASFQKEFKELKI